MLTSACPHENISNVDHSAEEQRGDFPSGTPDANSWRILVDQIQRGNPEGMAELYRLFTRGIRFYFFRQLGPQELDDKVHDTFLIVVEAIQRGDLREPERLMGFVRTIVRRQVAAHIDNVVQQRRDHTTLEPGVPLPDRSRSPEENLLGQEKLDIMVRTLRGLSARDREVLTRFYLQEQSQQQICAEMNLTDTQFRLLKSRAKQKFGEMGRRRLERKRNILLRAFSTLSH